MTVLRRKHSPWTVSLILTALKEAFLKLTPRQQIGNPVMFALYIVSLLTIFLYIQALLLQGEESPPFILAISIWLWFTLLFANFAESMAEGRGKAQAQSLRQARHEILARKLAKPKRGEKVTLIQSALLREGDFVLVEAGDFIPADGEVIDGVASVNESAITGESAPVIRESGGDRSAVTGGTQVISDWLVIRITANPGESFLDHMIQLVEGAKRQKTPNELALTLLLAALTMVFLVVCASLLPFSIYSVHQQGSGEVITVTVLAALFVCLAPTTIGGLLSAIGISGMDRMIQANVIAMSGRAVETAGDVSRLILDKTGTVTLGNRRAIAFIPAAHVAVEQLADAAQLASLADETPEGRSIVILAKKKYDLRGRNIATLNATFIPFTAETRMSGANLPGRQIRKGAAIEIEQYVKALGGSFLIR